MEKLIKNMIYPDSWEIFTLNNGHQATVSIRFDYNPTETDTVPSAQEVATTFELNDLKELISDLQKHVDAIENGDLIQPESQVH
ncbi:hypothetical protein [Brenneria goodwinii]|uniref:hypothetical protein n=1 Tax=Brenneria goodwinii TaxID=1109412 RepID=UPI0036E7F61B